MNHQSRHGHALTANRGKPEASSRVELRASINALNGRLERQRRVIARLKAPLCPLCKGARAVYPMSPACPECC